MRYSLSLLLLLLIPGNFAFSQDNEEPFFSVVLLPDTQFYAETYHDEFFAQTQWIKDNIEAEKIRMVIHLGDIVQNRNEKKEEWEIARKAFRTIDGLVPYTVAPGNHDQELESRDSTLYNQYFPYSDYEDYDWYGGHMGEDNDNNYTFFEAENLKFLVLNLEMHPDEEVMTWAIGVIEAHPNHRIILATHHYLGHNGWAGTADQLWDKVINTHENVFMVVCGHITGYATMITPNIRGNMVYQILSDYQGMDGGKGWMRTLRFYPKSNRIVASELSPTSSLKEDRGIRSTLFMYYNME
jgi:3',5'-cyclic AMP phosphodiesterase CpdA